MLAEHGSRYLQLVDGFSVSGARNNDEKESKREREGKKEREKTMKINN